MSLQERLNKLLTDNGMNKAGLARNIGVTRATVTDWCNGKTINLSMEHAYAIGKLFDKDPHWVATGKVYEPDYSQKKTVNEKKSSYGVAKQLSKSQQVILRSLQTLFYEGIEGSEEVLLKQIIDMIADKHNTHTEEHEKKSPNSMTG